MRILVPKTSRKAFQSWLPSLLAALAWIGCGSPSSLQAAPKISAYRDSRGKVIFINDAPAEPSSPPASSPVKTTPPAADSTPLSPPPQEDSAVPAKAVRPSLVAAAWNEDIEAAASRNQVDPDLVRAIVQVESNFNPYAVSPRGAKGLMQLIPATAQRFGVRNVFDPRANLDGGVRYLKYLMNIFSGDLKLSLAAYNAGENAVGRHNGVPPFRETQDYLRKIAQIYPLASAKLTQAEFVRIEKYVDIKGVVHFSNTEMP